MLKLFYMTDSERIIKFKEYTGMSFNKLAEYIGIKTSQTLYDIKSGKHGISKDLAEKIQAKYLNINTSWLLTGEGEMLKSQSGGVVNEEQGESEVSVEHVRLLPLYAQGGSLNDFTVTVKDSDCEKVLSPVKGADFAIQVHGDSMSPEYPSGSLILIKKINEAAFIEWGKSYVLDTVNGSVVKMVVPSDKEGCIRCVSINPDPRYAPFDVPLSSVFGIYRVLMCMSMK